MNSLITHNGQSVEIDSIPNLVYDQFINFTVELLKDTHNHCVNYFAFKSQGGLKFMMCIADDSKSEIHLFSHFLHHFHNTELESISNKIFALHIFEREIAENFGIKFLNHPWAKPLRFPHNRAYKSNSIYDYPFFKISGEAIHEVGVGPIHAGVIEPGHFRFQCHGEYVHHLEIQLGWQHRGIEQLMIEKKLLIQRNVLAESIAGDTAIAHALAFCLATESLVNVQTTERIDIQRALALELERIAIHVGDLSAMATDVAYQLGANVYGALRTPIINFMQLWCGNRFGKGLMRVGCMGYELNSLLIQKLNEVLTAFEIKFVEMSNEMFSLPSVLSRFETTGQVNILQTKLVGAVGMAARMSGLFRDIRYSHPFAQFKRLTYQPVILESGDVWARAKLRQMEIMSSIRYIRELIQQFEKLKSNDAQEIPKLSAFMKANSLVVALTEGWRGEICHCTLTDSKGEIIHYKIKDPSVHNWMVLALALRENEISDFPINNKSFDLSYCGHDL